MKLKTIEQIKNLANKTVLVRADYNVALKGDKVLETERIERSFATINYLLKHKAKVVIMSHLGRPDGKVNPVYSLKPIVKYLNKITKQNVQFVGDCIGHEVKNKIYLLRPGQILLLENLRFYPGEESNDQNFAAQLAESADILVNEAFSVCHRAHASVAAITKYLPTYAGLNLAEEVNILSKLLKGYKKPAVAIIGGVKISTKIKVIENLIKKYNYILIGGALANNFFIANKLPIGKSIFEKDFIKLASSLYKKYEDKLILPIDLRITNKVCAGSKVEEVSIMDLPNLKNKNWQIVDIGPKTEIYFESFINMAQTVVWNGPMGIMEIADFAHGTDYICQRVAAHARGAAFGVVGGGETIVTLDKLKLKNWPDFVSTAGGAMLEFLEGKILPGLKPLIKK